MLPMEVLEIQDLDESTEPHLTGEDFDAGIFAFRTTATGSIVGRDL